MTLKPLPIAMCLFAVAIPFLVYGYASHNSKPANIYVLAPLPKTPESDRGVQVNLDTGVNVYLEEKDCLDAKAKGIGGAGAECLMMTRVERED